MHFKTKSGAIDGIDLGTAGQFLKVNSGATVKFGAVNAGTEYTSILQVTVNSDTQSLQLEYITQSIDITIVAPVICHADFTHSYESGLSSVKEDLFNT